jgi:hypothetical protein
MKMDFLPLELSKTEQITPEAILKNHSKSQKNRKMINQIVLDIKLVVLRNKHTIWDTLVHVFFITLDLCLSP